MEPLFEIDCNDWHQSFSNDIQNQAIEALEQGKVLFFPALAFQFAEDEQGLLTPSASNGKAKNVSYNSRTKKIAGTAFVGDAKNSLQKLMARYADYTQTLVHNLLPGYMPKIQQGRTSYRPQEALNRKAPSFRKDDMRLHVDAFASTPVRNNRILRVFCNVNPANQDRIWRTGEPFEKVVAHFKKQLIPYSKFKASLLNLFQTTKTHRTAYDHYMLQLHDKMKEDMDYQEHVDQREVHFPSGSTWIVYSDCTSHAAMSGQYMLEQTYYLPYQAMQNPALAPQSILARAYNAR